MINSGIGDNGQCCQQRSSSPAAFIENLVTFNDASFQDQNHIKPPEFPSTNIKINIKININITTDQHQHHSLPPMKPTLLSFLLPLVTLPLLPSASAQAHGESFAQTMGPVAFMWPPDRPWSETEENVAPCGSSAGVSNRTDFPLTGGNLLLVAQDEAWAVEIAISYKANPTSINDFSPWFKTNVTAELDSAHTCYSAPDIPSSVKPGDVGTIQLVYNAEDGSKNISHFACADVRFVELSAFRASGYSVFCFNTTEGESAPEGTPSSVSYASGSVSATTLSVASTAASPSSTTTSSNAAYSNFGVSSVLALFAGVLAVL